MNQSEVLERLRTGNARFVEDKLDGKLQDSKRRDGLTGGQSPYAIVLSCADSRVVPELAFDTGLGELFVIRVAGNVANTDTVASIEYAVAHLKTEVIVVLGHQSCGAVGAALSGGDNGYNLNHLLAQITPAINKSESKEVDAVVKTNARCAAHDMVTRSEIIKNAVDENKLKIIPAFYELDSGKISFLD